MMPKVKILEWASAKFCDAYDRQEAGSPFGYYSVGEYSDGGVYYTVPRLGDDDGERADIEAQDIPSAKTACQADFEKQALSCFEAVDTLPLI